MENNLQIGAVIMASGFSKRMGKNKLLLHMGGQSMILRVINAVSTGELDKIIVVYANNETVEDISGADIELLLNEHPEKGQSESIKLGVKKLYDFDGIMFLPADMPFISEKTVNHLCSLFQKNKEKIIVACYNGVRKSPVIFPKKKFDDLLNLSGDMGGKILFSNNNQMIIDCHIKNEIESIDIDNIEQYNQYKKRCE